MPKKSRTSKKPINFSLRARARSASLALAGGTKLAQAIPQGGLNIHFGPGSKIDYNAPDVMKMNPGANSNLHLNSGMSGEPVSPGPASWWKTSPSNVSIQATSKFGNNTTMKGGKQRGGRMMTMTIPNGGDMNLSLKPMTLNNSNGTEAAAAAAATAGRLSCCPTCNTPTPTPANTQSSSVGSLLQSGGNNIKMMPANFNIGIKDPSNMNLKFTPSPPVDVKPDDGSTPCCPSCPTGTVAGPPKTGGKRRRKKGGQFGQIINTALVPGSLLYLQNKYSKKRGFSSMLPKFGGKTRRRCRK
jgi:hypothetical protein